VWVWVRWRRLLRVAADAADLGNELGGAAAWGGGFGSGERGARLRLDQAVSLVSGTARWVWFGLSDSAVASALGFVGNNQVSERQAGLGGGLTYSRRISLSDTAHYSSTSEGG
jgi:hypothetical protein